VGVEDVGVNPRETGELFQGESRDRTFVAFPNPFERKAEGDRCRRRVGRVTTERTSET
jgi:hypothetical protein